MPNPTLRHLDPVGEPEPDRPTDNGILAKLGGSVIGGASHALPKAAADQEAQPVQHVDVTVEPYGLVRVTYELKTQKRGRSRHWYWVATFAEKV